MTNSGGCRVLLETERGPSLPRMALLTSLSHFTGSGCEFQAWFGFAPGLLHQRVSMPTSFRNRGTRYSFRTMGRLGTLRNAVSVLSPNSNSRGSSTRAIGMRQFRWPILGIDKTDWIVYTYPLRCAPLPGVRGRRSLIIADTNVFYV